jgi:drug/metabolite transporter (DMT)-like permease
MTTDPQKSARLALPVWLAFVMLVMTAVFWSGTTIVGRAAAGEIPPYSLTFWRWTIAFVIFIPFGFGPFWRQRDLYRRYFWRMAGFSFFGIVGFTIFFFTGMQLTTGINGSLLQAAGPVIIVLASLVILKIGLTPGEVVGTLIAIVGSMVIVLHGDMAQLAALQFGLGDICIILSMLSWAIYTIYLRWKPEGLHPFGFIFVLSALSVPMLLPFYLWELAAGETFATTPANLGLILYSSVFASVVAYMFWNWGVAVVGANAAGFSHYLIPVFGTVLSVVLLDEKLETHHVIAMVIIFSGLYLTTRHRTH